MKHVRFEDVLEAQEVVHQFLHCTPLHFYPGLSFLLGADVFVKHENHHQTGAFKVRGGINLISSLSEEEKQAGVISATRGNHGLSIAFAAQMFGVKAVIVVPEGNSPEKNEQMLNLGVELMVFGRDFDEAREKAEQLQTEKGYRYIHPANEPKIIAGVGTYALEIFEDLKEPDYIFLPIGLGSGISGSCVVAEHVNARVKIIGVQAENAPAVTLTWREGRDITTESANTIADGLATRVPAYMTMDIMQQRVDDILLVSEEEIKEGIRIFLKETHNLAEGAAAASLAAALKMKDKMAKKKVVLVLTGGNIDTQTLREVISD